MAEAGVNTDDHFGNWKRVWQKLEMQISCFVLKKSIICGMGDRGSTVVRVLCYKSEGRWVDSRRCHWNFSLT